MTVWIAGATRYWQARPARALSLLAVLALGIASSTVSLWAIDALIVRPVPWRAPDSLLRIWVARPHWRSNPTLAANWRTGSLSWNDFRELREKSTILNEIAVWSFGQPALAGQAGAPSQVVSALTASANLFDVLGVSLTEGRPFDTVEDSIGSHVALVSPEVARRLFAANAINQRVIIDGEPRTIVGVLPTAFRFDHAQPDFVLPLGDAGHGVRKNGVHFLQAVARLRPGSSLEAAREEAARLLTGNEDPFQRTAAVDLLVAAEASAWVRSVSMLAAAGLLMLLTSAANAAVLFVADGHARSRDRQLRMMLGATSGRIVREALLEAGLLTAIGGVLGILLAVALVNWSAVFVTGGANPLAGTRVGLPVVIAIAVIVSVTSAALGALSGLTGPSSVHGKQGRMWESGFIVVQAATCAVLVAAALVMAGTLHQLNNQAVGFGTGNLIAMTLRRPPPTAESAASSTQRLLSAMAAVHGVSAVAASDVLPFVGSARISSIEIRGWNGADDLSARTQFVTADYFDVMAIRPIAGRTFAPADRGRPLAVVSARLARDLMDGHALGKVLRLKNRDWCEVIGVVGDVRHGSLREVDAGALYLLADALPQGRLVSQFAVRTESTARGVIAGLRDAVGRFDPSIAVDTLEPLSVRIDRSIGADRIRAVVAMAMAAVALTLVGLGLYGVTSRRAAGLAVESAIRAALGESPLRCATRMIRSALMPVLLGLAVAIPASFGAARLLTAMAAATMPDTAQLALGPFWICGPVALCACAVPAWRATRIDIVGLLRAR